MKSVDPERRASSLRALTNLLPDLANNVLNLYNRAWTFTDDKIPPLAFSQSAVRFAKLLSAVHLSLGVLDDALLSHLVLNAGLPATEDFAPRKVPFMTKGEIVEFLFRGYPGLPSDTGMTVADYVIVLAGIASVLSSLDCHRKKALVLRELMVSLLPALVQARKDGAAEMGVHPAASLASLNATVNTIPTENSELPHDHSEQGMRHFLWFVCQSYGVVPSQASSVINLNATTSKSSNSNETSVFSIAQIAETTGSRALQQASARAAGSLDLKIDVLRSCINICEALPDLGGALQFSADLLRTGGSGIAPGPYDSSGSSCLSVDEQVRLVNNIYRTLSAARQLGLKHPEAEYWDDFLVRGIEAVGVNSPRSLQLHVKSELEVTGATDNQKERNPFIYNPSSKSKTFATNDPLSVAKERSLFRVTLQNLYDFEISVERIKLLSDGVPLECEAQSTIIGPYRTQTIILNGTPLSSGTLKVHGCLAKIKGCHERSFLTFTEAWSPRPSVKEKPTGLAERKRSRPPVSGADNGRNTLPPKGPVASTLISKVLGAQPNVTLKSLSAPQGAIMLLEGESKIIQIFLQNESKSTPADLLLFSFHDSSASHRQSALSNKELTAGELYDLELDLAHKQPFRLRHEDNNQDFELDAGGEIKLIVEVLGKPGLSQGAFQVDYGHLGIAKADIQETFYTRQLAIPLTVTVNESVGVAASNIIALPQILSKNQRDSQEQILKNSIQESSHTSADQLQAFLARTDIHSSSNAHCLLLLDLHNSWSNTLTMTINLSDPSSDSPPKLHVQQIQPNTTQRIPLPLPRLYVSNPYAPIPSINPANKRQFVVSATSTTPEAERAMRECFWYREALLERMKATWREESSARNGDIDLRRLKLSTRMLNALKLPELEISMTVNNAENASESSPIESPDESDVHMVGSSMYKVLISTFLTLNTTLYNRSPTPIRPILRLQPRLSNQPHSTAQDLNKKLLVHGLLQRALPTLGPGQRTTVETGFLLLSYGMYEWRASVEELVPSARGESQSGRNRAATGEFDRLDDVGRRNWVAEWPCSVVARGDGEAGNAASEEDDMGRRYAYIRERRIVSATCCLAK